jgi:hypothetical protein
MIGKEEIGRPASAPQAPSFRAGTRGTIQDEITFPRSAAL